MDVVYLSLMQHRLQQHTLNENIIKKIKKPHRTHMLQCAICLEHWEEGRTTP